MNIDVQRAPLRPADECIGWRLMWVDEPGTMHTFGDGRQRGWRAGSNPTQRRNIPGDTSTEDPHSWWVLLVDENAWFARELAGRTYPQGTAIWVPLAMLLTD